MFHFRTVQINIYLCNTPLFHELQWGHVIFFQAFSWHRESRWQFSICQWTFQKNSVTFYFFIFFSEWKLHPQRMVRLPGYPFHFPWCLNLHSWGLQRLQRCRWKMISSQRWNDGMGWWGMEAMEIWKKKVRLLVIKEGIVGSRRIKSLIRI